MQDCADVSQDKHFRKTGQIRVREKIIKTNSVFYDAL